MNLVIKGFSCPRFDYLASIFPITLMFFCVFLVFFLSYLGR